MGVPESEEKTRKREAERKLMVDRKKAVIDFYTPKKDRPNTYYRMTLFLDHPTKIMLDKLTKNKNKSILIGELIRREYEAREKK